MSVNIRIYIHDMMTMTIPFEPLQVIIEEDIHGARWPGDQRRIPT